MWLKFDTFSQYTQFIIVAEGQFVLYITAKKTLRWEIYNEESSVGMVENVLTDDMIDQWFMVSGYYNADEYVVSLTLDGVEATSTAFSIIACKDNAFTIGH